ncbi:RNA ligase [sediment metagenome]|uniref:RNA ligase n=1 Tax=sediment metagenome TaxID=749907 RepID=D9PH56_9ZZZZ
MARTLASIQRIVSMDPIPGADKIMHAGVLGWKCITAIDNGLKIGDLVIYIEIDSRVPPIPQFAFLEKRHYKVKTIKMRGVYSQGLIMPPKDFPTILGYEEGKDVTDILGITKIDTYEPGECSFGNKEQHPLDRFLCKFKIYRKLRPYILRKKERGWPSEIPHTDETRVQALWGTLQGVLQLDKKWYITVKVDGQSGTYYYKKRFFGKDFFGIYSRELRKKEGDNSNWAQIATKYRIREELKRFCEHHGVKSVWIQGEIAGPGIQKNKDHFTEKKFFIFNVYVPEEKKYVGPDGMVSFCEYHKMEMVPLISRKISLKDKTIDDLVEMSKGPSEWSKDDLREGIVIRELEDMSLNRISFKIVNPEFLLKYGC